eukprot:4032890-Alexandrium_andersonii.AAC.1
MPSVAGDLLDPGICSQPNARHACLAQSCSRPCLRAACHSKIPGVRRLEQAAQAIAQEQLAPPMGHGRRKTD